MASIPQKVQPRWNKSTPFKGAKRTKSPNDHIYRDPIWTKASEAFREGKTCEMAHTNECKGVLTVDHIINPANHKGIDFWDKSNWRVLCRRHHARKTNKDTGIKKAKAKKAKGL